MISVDGKTLKVGQSSPKWTGSAKRTAEPRL